MANIRNSLFSAKKSSFVIALTLLLSSSFSQDSPNSQNSQGITPPQDGQTPSHPQESNDRQPPPSWSFQENSSSQVSYQWSEAERFAFNPNKEKPWQTNAVLIIKDDTILFEKYANGVTKDTPHRLWSVSKSLAGALIGKRLQELNLDIEAPIYPYEPLLTDGLKRKLTFKNLLQMSSGLQWNEFYESNPFESHVVDMLYINNHEDMGTFVAKRPLYHMPGEVFNYSSGETNLLMKVLRQTFEKKQDYDDYPWNILFDPIGIQSATWEQDKSGTFIGSSYAFMTARDLARFGRLMMAGGVWKEGEKVQRILERNYVDKTFQMAPSVCQTISKGNTNRFGYGLQWWLNKECPNKKLRAYPDLPQTLKMALGHHGQSLILIPELNAIIVRFGADKLGRFKVNDWLKIVYGELKK